MCIHTHTPHAHPQIAFDGLWIDMNEPSNFKDDGARCTTGKWDNPPYKTGAAGNGLGTKTLCMSTRQAAGMHYDVHSLYGYLESVSTKKALEVVRPGVRTIVISRSTFANSGGPSTWCPICATFCVAALCTYAYPLNVLLYCHFVRCARGTLVRGQLSHVG
jgi:hypothetical protein